MWLWHLGTRFSGEDSGGAGQMVVFDGLGGLFQPEGFCDSIIHLPLAVSTLPVQESGMPRVPVDPGSICSQDVGDSPGHCQPVSIADSSAS